MPETSLLVDNALNDARELRLRGVSTAVVVDQALTSLETVERRLAEGHMDVARHFIGDVKTSLLRLVELWGFPLYKEPLSATLAKMKSEKGGKDCECCA